MLEHVALNQTGFRTPGVAPDARGVLLGKLGAALLPSVDRAVSFFRLLSEESSLDDILPGTRLLQVRSSIGARELLVLLPAPNSYLLDRCARVAALCGGQLLTGSGKHLVQYRDRRSPLGYDIQATSAEPADYILYTDTSAHGYTRIKDIPFAGLVQQLALRPVPGGPHRDVDELSEREVLWILCRRGLGPRVLRYLLLSSAATRPGRPARLKVSGALLPLLAPAATAPPPTEADLDGAAWLLRVHELPPRPLQLLLDLPGVEVLRNATDNVLCALGYRHPLRLSSCTSAFDKERFYLFSGARGRCLELGGLPPLVPGDSLLQVRFDLDDAARAPAPPPQPLPAQQVPLRLLPSDGGRRRVSGALVSWSRLPWFRQLVYLLPPTLLKGYRAAAIKEGLFVVCSQGIECLPMGDLFHECAPSIFVPVGMDFLPRISPEVLTDHVGGVAGRCVVFRPVAVPGAALDSPGDPPGSRLQILGLPLAGFEELGRRALAPLQIDERAIELGELGQAGKGRPLTEPREPLLVNDPVGGFALWGFRGALRDEDLP